MASSGHQPAPTPARVRGQRGLVGMERPRTPRWLVARWPRSPVRSPGRLRGDWSPGAGWLLPSQESQSSGPRAQGSCFV